MASARPSGKRKSEKAPRAKGSRPSGGRAARFLAAFGAIAALGITLAMLWVGMAYLNVVYEVRDRMAGQRWDLPTRLYPRPLVLEVGASLPSAELGESLAAMGYQRQERVQRGGEYRAAEAGKFYVYPYDPPRPGGDTVTGRVEVRLSGRKITGLTAYDTKTRLSRVELPGLPFAEIQQGAHEARRIYRLKEIGEDLKDAVVAIEDERFYQHGALDPLGITRALFVNLTSGELRQGGSTLTQQAVKNFFLTQERTLSRKLKEVLYSVALERNYSKDQILELYLNEIYLGQDGAVAICGMGEAAYRYFSRKPSQLSLAEAATLAGMIQAPNAYNPERNAEKARRRRDVVLAKMEELGKITPAERKAAAAEAIVLRPGAYALKEAPYFVDAVMAELGGLGDAATLASAGFRVQTSLDWRVQRAAERALDRGLDRLGKGLQGAVVVLDPRTGALLALVGGRSWEESQFNRALNARRQPGSAFKPLVFAAAFRRKGHDFGPTTELVDEALTLKVEGGKTWTPQNFDDIYRGPVTARQTLEESLNVPTVRLARDIGLDAVVDVARDAGIESACAEAADGRRDCDTPNPAWRHPSLALGAKEVTPLELARAYTALATDGRTRAPRSVSLILDQGGGIVKRGDGPEDGQVLPADQAWMLRFMLRGVVDNGTASGVRSSGYTWPAAGKTGTTNDGRDAWFVGFDRDYLTVVWIGYDDNRTTGLTGGKAAAPIWAELMKGLRGSKPPPDDPVPTSITLVDMCVESHAPASDACPQKVKEAFWTDHLGPVQTCPLHGRPVEVVRQRVRSWLERMLGDARLDMEVTIDAPPSPPAP